MNHAYTRSKIKMQLRGDILNILGEEIYYRLYKVKCGGKGGYAINITSGKESSTCFFGCNRFRAADIYEKIVRNTVTPCALRDIAEDFAKQKQ